MTKPIDLDELERLHAAATPGPWCDDAEANPSDVSIYREDEWLANCGKPFKLVGQIVESEADNARLIVALRNAFPALLAELRARRRQGDALAALYAVVIKQNTLGAAWHTSIFGELMAALSAAQAALEPAAPAKGGEGKP